MNYDEIVFGKLLLRFAKLLLHIVYKCMHTRGNSVTLFNKMWTVCLRQLHDDVFILHALALWPVTVMTTVLGEYRNSCLYRFTRQLHGLISLYCICQAPVSDAQYIHLHSILPVTELSIFLILEFFYVLLRYNIINCLLMPTCQILIYTEILFWSIAILLPFQTFSVWCAIILWTLQ